jgi:hypothetical protein
MKIIFLSVREWIRQYVQRDGVYFSLPAIWKLYRKQHVRPVLCRRYSPNLDPLRETGTQTVARSEGRYPAKII